MKKKTKQFKKTTFKRGNQITSSDLTAVEAKQRKANTDPVIPPNLGVTKDASVSELKELISWHKKRYDDDMGVQGATIGSLTKTVEALKEKLEAKNEVINDQKKETEELHKIIVSRDNEIAAGRSLNARLSDTYCEAAGILRTVQSILKSLNWIAKLLKGKSITKVLKEIDSILKNS